MDLQRRIELGKAFTRKIACIVAIASAALLVAAVFLWFFTNSDGYELLTAIGAWCAAGVYLLIFVIRALIKGEAPWRYIAIWLLGPFCAYALIELLSLAT